MTNNQLTDAHISNATLIRLIRWADEHNSHYVAAALRELQKRRKAAMDSEPVFFIEVEGDDWINAGRIPGSTFDFNNLPDGINNLYAAPQPAPVVSFYRDGIEAAAKWIDQQREAYDSEHGWSDPDTGAFEFGNDAQREYSSTLEELAEGIRALHPNAGMQPAPVVPDDVLDALQKVARIRLDMNDFDGDRRGIADCLGDAEEALIEVVNRRAATVRRGAGEG